MHAHGHPRPKPVSPNVIKSEAHMSMQIWKMYIEANDVCWSMDFMDLGQWRRKTRKKIELIQMRPFLLSGWFGKFHGIGVMVPQRQRRHLQGSTSWEMALTNLLE